MKITSNRGSVLLTAVILGFIMALAAATYIAVSVGAYQRANRAFYYNSALNLAESGAEEAMWALNNTADSHDWTQRAWTGTTNRTLLGSLASPDFTDANGTKGYYNVYVKDADTTNPTITVESVIQPVRGSAIKKQIKLLSTRLSTAIPGFAAKDSAKIGGDVDSYDPALGTFVTAPRGYDVTVASPTVDVGDVILGANGNIYGHLSIGVPSSNSTAFVNSIKGSLVGPTTTYPSSGVVKAGSNLIDTNLISYDYEQSFPMPDPPTGTVTSTSLPAADANGYIVIGDPSGTQQRYDLSSMTIGNGKTLLIVGPVKLVVSGTVDVKSGGAVTVLSGSTTITGGPPSGITKTYTGSSAATADLYGYSDISISGQGTVVPLTAGGSDPEKFKIWGMKSSAGQTITVGGNGDLAAVIYAPNADLVFNGGGSTGYFAGTMVGNTVKINGAGYKIRIKKGAGSATLAQYFTIDSWLELTDRSLWHTF